MLEILKLILSDTFTTILLFLWIVLFMFLIDNAIVNICNTCKHIKRLKYLTKTQEDENTS